MKDKIDSLTERFVQDLRAAVAHEILKLLENVVGAASTPAPKPAPKDGRKTKKKSQSDLDYQRHWRLVQKIKAGKPVTPEDTKWHTEYLKKRKK